MIKLLRYLKGYEKESVLGPLFKLLEATLELFVPLVVASLIDVGIAENNTSYMLRMFIYLILLGLVGLLFSVTAQFFAARAAVGFVKKIRQALFAHMESLSYTEIDRLGTAQMITRMTSDVNQVQAGMNLTLRLLLRSPFVVAGAFIMACHIDMQVARVFGLTILALVVIVFGIMFLTIPLYRRVQQRVDRVLAATRENLIGVRVIRAFGMEEDEKRRFNDKQNELTRQQEFVGRISALLNPLSYSIINVGIALMIWKGALQVEAGLLTQGAVVALYNYMAQILEELIKLANMLINLTKAVACGNRIQDVFETKSCQQYPDSTLDKPDDRAPQVVFEHVSLKYATGGEESLTDISFSVEKGMVVGIIGGTGSGKTSLVNLIPRFYDATRGSILIEGIEVSRYSKKELREKIAVVPQKAVLVKGTIRDNLYWGKAGASDEELWEALSVAQAKEMVEAKEGKLDFGIEQNGRNLSGGQKQRLTIARAMVRKPDILILDDSSSALDYATDAALRNALKEMKDRPTVFLVSQRTVSIQHADLILVLEDGRLVGMGTHEALLEECKTYEEIYSSQFKKEVSAS
ncbi:MAG: ABC transporter ATP-binding protein/permease [Lachnospiraceae bacterium]|nr:ABC transporter ATP-binding protein/permease [Lachnospiraceae bacterium]MDD7026356.1 ABC transporter ATP-binding protein [Lachnospiraceae bacterium]MDY5701637.1 ABC transporter ATP-binding protein [Lachnospiraceae bacterium]